MEFLLGLAVLVIALAAIYGVTTQAIRSVGVTEDLLEVQQDAHAALDKISEEARWTEHVRVATVTCPLSTLDQSCVSLDISANNPLTGAPYRVSFRWNSAANHLERIEGNRRTVLTNDVTGLIFQYMTQDGNPAARADEVVRLEATIEVRRRTGTSVRVVASDVFLRNTVRTPTPLRL